MAATLTEVVKELQKQNRTLNNVRDRLDAEARAREATARQDAEDRRKALEDKREQKGKTTAGQTGGFKSDVISGVKSATGFNLLENLAGYLKPLVSGVFAGLFGGAAIAGLRTGIGKMVGRGLIFGPAILLLQQFGESALTALFTDVNKYLEENGLGLNPQDVKSLAGSVNDALINGLMLATVFGRKGLFAGFLGSLLKDAFTAMFPDVPWEQKAKILGFELPITNETFAMIGGTMAAYFGPSLLYGAVTKAFGGSALAFPGARVGRNAKGQFMKLSNKNRGIFRTSFSRGGLLAGTILSVVGAAMSSYVESEFGETAGDVTSWTTQGAALGATFGIKGALVGAIAGLAIGGGAALVGWLQEKDKAIRNAAVAGAEKALKDATDESGNIDLNTLDEEGKKAIQRAEYEAKRAKELITGATENELAILDAITEAKAQQRAEDTGALSQTGIKQLVFEAYTEGSKEKIVSAAIETLRRAEKDITAENVADIIPDLIRYMETGTDKFEFKTQSAIGEAIGNYFDTFDQMADAIRAGEKEISSGLLGFGAVTPAEAKKRSDEIFAETKELNKLIKEYLESTRTPVTPPLVVDSSTKVQNNSSQSMVTNNGPAVDVSDHMLMRHGAPSAL